jgi:hypothetical protein
VYKTHIFINNWRYGEIGKALGFSSTFGDFIGLCVSRDAFMPWNPSDIDRTPGIDNNPCLGDNKPWQILSQAGKVGCAALDCRLRICKDGVMTSRCNLRAESGQSFVDRSQFGVEKLLVQPRYKLCPFQDASIILP